MCLIKFSLNQSETLTYLIFALLLYRFYSIDIIRFYYISETIICWIKSYIKNPHKFCDALDRLIKFKFVLPRDSLSNFRAQFKIKSTKYNIKAAYLCLPNPRYTLHAHCPSTVTGGGEGEVLKAVIADKFLTLNQNLKINNG